MLKLMQKKTLELVRAPAADAAAAAAPAAAAAVLPLVDPSRPVYSAMVAKLTVALRPSVLDIKDDSASHAGHGGSKGLRNGETHFSVAVVSEAFAGLPLVARHRLVYAALQTELAEGLHALSIDAKTGEEASR
jgi:stress-induced morphogen